VIFRNAAMRRRSSGERTAIPRVSQSISGRQRGHAPWPPRGLDGSAHRQGRASTPGGFEQEPVRHL
jgi:hypothetical protein